MALLHHPGQEFGALVHFYVESVDGLYEEFKQRGVTPREPPHNELGPDIRCMGVTDPDGNQLRFLTVTDSPG